MNGISAPNRDNTWRDFHPKYRGVTVRRKGGLSDFIPMETNGVVVVGYLLNGQLATAHFTNLDIEKLPGFMFAKKPKKVKEPKVSKSTDLDLDLL